jgi:hypothetical protein
VLKLASEKVPVNPVLSRSAQLVTSNVPQLIVPDPEFASKKTLSEDVGTDDPPEPPEVVDHFDPAVLSQSSDPPTQ